MVLGTRSHPEIDMNLCCHSPGQIRQQKKLTSTNQDIKFWTSFKSWQDIQHRVVPHPPHPPPHLPVKEASKTATKNSRHKCGQRKSFIHVLNLCFFPKSNITDFLRSSPPWQFQMCCSFFLDEEKNHIFIFNS